MQVSFLASIVYNSWQEFLAKSSVAKITQLLEKKSTADYKLE
jgi:Tfp pilus assembly protein PilE